MDPKVDSPGYESDAFQSGGALRLNTPDHPNESAGLEASMWAPQTQKHSLRNLPGLRPPPPAHPVWDNSNGYTAPSKIGSRLSLNQLSKHAYREVVKFESANKESATAPRSTSGHSELITSSVLGKTNAADLPSASKITGPERVQSLAQGSSEQSNDLEPRHDIKDKSTLTPYVPPHLRTPEPRRKKAIEAKGKQRVGDDNSSNSPSFVSTRPSIPRSAESKDVYRDPLIGSSPTLVASSPLAESSSVQVSRGQPTVSASASLAPTTTSAIIDEEHKTVSARNAKLPPHLRAPKPKVVLPSKPKGQEEAVKPNGNATSQPTTLQGEHKEEKRQEGAATDKKGDGSAARTTPKASSRSNGQSKDKQNATNSKEWDKPSKPVHPLLDWEGKRNGHHDDWEGRRRDSISAREQLQIFESWTQASESAADVAAAHLDIASPAFILGTGIVHNGSLSTGLSDEAHFTRRLPNDPLTHARAEQTAQSIVKERMAKMREEGTEPRSTKKQTREYREALRQRDLESKSMPNPYAPTADIYIRPAQIKDLPQITDTYNHYVRTSAITLELDLLTRDMWRTRMEDCREEGYEMYVAVQKGGKGNGTARRDNREAIFGFAYAEDQSDRRSSCRFSAIVQVYVNWKHLRIGVGRCLLDRVMATVNINHHDRRGVDWVDDKRLTQREIKTVMIEIPYWDSTDEERAVYQMAKNERTGQMERVPGWKASFLEKVGFEHAYTAKSIGFKKASLEKGKS